MKSFKRLVSFLLAFSMVLSMFLTVSAVENNTRATERTGITMDRVTSQNTFGESVTHTEGYYWTDKKLEAIPVTYEAWVYMPSSVSYPKEGNVILSTLPQVYAAGTANFFSFELKNGSEPKLMFGYNNKEVTEVVFWNEGRVPKDQWVHLALVHDTLNQTVSCYHNGELKESKTFAFVPDSSAIESYVALAGDRATANARAFTGILGDVAVYADVRSAAEVSKDYVSGADVNDDDLLLYYQISADKQEKDLKDLSGNGYDMNYNRVFLTEEEMQAIRDKDDKEYAYSIAFIPDIQILTEYFPEKLPPVFDYVLDNIDDKNIKYMVTLGDLTDTNTQEEWDLVKAQLDRFNGILPYSIFRGNHDGVWKNQPAIYDSIFADPNSDYYKHVQANGGFYDTSSVKNTYLLFEEGGTKYMLLNLDYGITDEKVLDWADEVIEAHPDRRVIIATHAWLGSHGEPFATGEWSSPGTEVSGSIDPDRMWEEHFRKHANIDMIICGHSHSDQILCTPVVGDNGNVVYQVLMDSQCADCAANNAGKGLGGVGVVGIMYFTEDGRFAKIEYYSTIFERYYYEGHTDISLDFDAEKVVYSAATDVDGKLLNVKDVNDTVWVEDEDGLYLSGDYTNGLLVFDDKLNANRIEFTIVDKFMNDGDANHRNGIVFALTDEEGDGSFGYDGKDISYYWLFLQGDTNTLRILEMGKYNPDWTRFTDAPDFSLADNGIDAKNGVRIEVEWDEQGNIKVWADGKVAFDFKDETPLTGDLYGLMVNDWSNKVSNGHSDSVDANFTSFIAGKVIYDNCIDVDGNPLNVKVVNGVTWVEKNGMVEMPAGPSNSFLLFDSKLNANRIEATIVIRDNIGTDTNSHRNGLVFALTDHDGDLTFNYNGTDVSYYWAFVTDDDKVEVRKMGKYNGWSVIGPASATLTSLGIDVTKGVALAAEWDDQGHIKVYANGILVQDITDTRGDPLTGKYYGMLVYKYGNSQGPDYAFPYDAPVMSFVAGKTPIGDICTDADGNALNPVFVNGIEWTVVDGKLKMPKGHENSFLLFDKELTVNRIEATLVINDNINNDPNHRNGIVFALTDHDKDLKFADYTGTDVSYYWAFVNDSGKVEVIKMDRGNGLQWHWLSTQAVDLKTLGIDITKGVTLAAEWNDNGRIKVYANGQLVQDVTDTTEPLTGKYYGLLVNKYGNTQGPDYAYPYNAHTTSFVAGKEATVTPPPTPPTKPESYENCVGGEGNLLTPSFINNVYWTLSEGKLYMPGTAGSSFLLFDDELAVNKIETKFVDNNCDGTDGDKRNGIVFALTDHGNDLTINNYWDADISYYWAYINDWNNVCVFKMAAGQGADQVWSMIGRDVPVANDGGGITLAVEWDDQGHIKVYANGRLTHDITDTGTPLTGKYYGLLSVDKDNVSAPSMCDAYYTSFVAGKEFTNINKGVTLGGRIDIMGREPIDKEFAVVVSKSNGNFSVVGDNVASASVDSYGRFELTIYYSAEDVGKTLYYTVTQINFGRPGVKYDTLVYNVTVTLLIKDGDVEADISIEGGAEPDSLLFINEYTITPATVTVTADEGGRVSGGGTFEPGTQTTVTATANEGYKFVGWYENGELVSAEATISFAAADRALTAKFISVNDYQQIVLDSVEIVAGEEAVIKLVIKNNPGITGLVVTLNYDKNVLTLVGAENGTLFSGFESALNITWDEIFDVTEDGVLATLTFAVAEGAQAGDYTIEVLVRGCTNANFESVEISAVNGAVTVISKPEPTTVTVNAAATAGGTVTGAGEYEIGTSVTVTATPDVGYKFLGWYDGETKVSANATYTFTAAENVSLTAKFEKLQPTVEITTTDSDIVYTVEGNTVKVSYDLACKVGYLSGDKYVALTATANGDGSYSYTVPEGVTSILVVVSGDVNGDGAVNAGDYGRLNAMLQGKINLNAVETFAANTNGDTSVNAGDYGRLNAVLQGKTSLTW